ncbi:MAG TPA: choice-of-anchor P family protein [Vicinamibacterales bacterium]|nr:choice-of-anchor P family protein [Vicinamibacterales bacterium]
MHTNSLYRWSLLALGLAAAGLGWPAHGSAQANTASGHARAVQATVAAPSGVDTTVLTDTGTLGSLDDAREASQNTGSIGSWLGGEALHATSIGRPDQVESEASLANLVLNVGGATVTADFVMSRAQAARGSRSGVVEVQGLVVNGTPIVVTGDGDQSVPFPGGSVVINESRRSQGGIVVNALHVIVDGAADVVVASASATYR